MKGLADIKKRAAAKMYGQVEEAELMCRMLGAAQHMTRPLDMSATEALSGLDPESRAWLRRMARAALGYMMECLNASEAPQ